MPENITYQRVPSTSKTTPSRTLSPSLNSCFFLPNGANRLASAILVALNARNWLRNGEINEVGLRNNTREKQSAEVIGRRIQTVDT